MNYNPRTKVVLGVRDPAEWSLSLHNQLNTHMLRAGPTYSQFIQGFPYPLGNQKIHMQLRNGFVTTTIENYREVFDHNLLLYHFNFFKKNPLAILRSIEHFLSLPNFYDEQNFDNSVINAGNRKNVGILTYILSREKVIAALGAVFPRKSILHLRKSFDTLSSKDKEGFNINEYPPENLQIARQVFAEEHVKIKELFEKCEVQLGSGEQFDHFFERN
jgi:hypothetical protein